jgi:hypothetical protein
MPVLHVHCISELVEAPCIVDCDGYTTKPPLPTNLSFVRVGLTSCSQDLDVLNCICPHSFLLRCRPLGSYVAVWCGVV